MPDDHSADAQGDPDFGPFGAPMFDGPEARALRRVGVIDVGSNSVRLVIFDGAARSPAYFFNEKILAGLGRGMAETGKLDPEGRARAMAAMRRFAILARGYDVNSLTAVATAAVREAADGPAFADEVAAETGIRMRVIDGAEEARLSAQGVLLGWPEADGLMCDIGGSSMELAELAQGRPGGTVSGPLGPLKLEETKPKARLKAIAEGVDAMAAALGRDAAERLYLVGGSWRAIARIDMERRGYPLRVLHEYTMTPDDLRATFAHVAGGDVEALGRASSTSAARMALVPVACEVLAGVLDRFGPEEVAVSSYGIREGLLYEAMSQALRDRDPLIEACRASEAASARVPGFGRVLYKFVRPVFEARADARRMRLIRAACLLHDVNWRAHPDYRAQVCFDSATRANLGGLTHAERVFLGLALLHRYKNKRDEDLFAPLAPLIDGDDVAMAEQVGRALRFGAMFAPQDAGLIGSLELDEALVLRLPKGAGEALFGEVAEARLRALASSLGVEAAVEAV